MVVATGAYLTPRIPVFASELDPNIVQLHSSEYRNPSQLREGGALVVGPGDPPPAGFRPRPADVHPMPLE